MKTVFVYWGPHPIHETWMKSVKARFYPFMLGGIVKNLQGLHSGNSVFFRSTILHQTLGFVNAARLPDAEMYVVEGIAALPAILARRKKRSKVVIINSDTFFYDYPHVSGIKKRIYRAYLKRVDGMISTSNYMKELAEKHIDVPHEVVNPYVEKRFFRVKGDLDSDNIGHIGGVRYSKGVDILVKAYLKWNRGKLYLIGHGHEKLDVSSIMKSNDNIVITGIVKNPESFLKRCGLYVNAARHEPFGVNILESMAAGIPPIVSENCGAKEYVAKVSDNLVIKPTTKNILDRINWLQDDIDEKKRLSKIAIKVAKTDTKEASIRRFGKALDRLLNKIR